MFAFSLPFFFVLLFTTTTTAQPYKPTDIFFLNCGSSTPSSSSSEPRWDGDEHSNFVPSNIRTISFSSAPDHLDSSVPETPYSNARVFKTSSFTYTFPVSQGPKFLRLHFYPATYSDLDTKQSFFSVSSNGYTLLTNFNAFLTLLFLRSRTKATDARVVKEFLIYVKDTQILNVTFTPSHNPMPSSMAKHGWGTYIHSQRYRQTAEQEVDLSFWTQHSGYPVFKDYIVFVNDPDSSRIGDPAQYIELELRDVIAPKCLRQFGMVAADAEKRVSGTMSENQEPLFPMQGDATNITDDDMFTESTLTSNGTSSISSSYKGFKSDTVFSEILKPAGR
ncbi:hypothetical protein L1987_51256 [Smallanthus sonchifolius]|uniref:Uncharacterized protein n=1 Tax=Smallanthus sonchifolius TaxID=185202 RepID=A0ACB9EQY5_9ASTR|nr:hypothetical protein L1987_51256 [Smallanthus sonchifolius]